MTIEKFDPEYATVLGTTLLNLINNFDTAVF